MSAISRRPLPAIIEALDDNGLEGIQKNFEAIFQENLQGFRLAELEAELDTLASARSYLVAAADGTLSVQAIAIPATDGGTGLVLYAVGDLLYADTTTTLAKLADIAAGSYLRSGGVSTAPVWSTLTLPNAATIGDILAATGTNATGVIGAVAVGRLLRSAGTGTLPAYSTFTIPDTFATGDILYGSATNVLTALADIATGNALISGGVGIAPSWGKIGLTTHVSGTLPIANGGTNATSFTNTRVPFFNGTSLVDDADLTFATDTLTATKLVAPTSLSTPSIITASGALGITPAAGSNLNVALSTTGDFAVNTNQLYVDTSAAFVGIGTASPEKRLTLAGPVASQLTLLKLRDLGGTATIGEEVSIDFGWFSDSLFSGRISGYKQTVAGDGSGGLKFYTASSGVGYNAIPTITLDKDGNVGISATDSRSKVDIRTTNTTTTLGTGIQLLVGSGESNINTYSQIGFGYAENNPGGIVGYTVTDATSFTKGALIFGTRNVTTNTAVTERMRIDAAGNVGIGTTPTTGALLDVAGVIMAANGSAAAPAFASRSDTDTGVYFDASDGLLFTTAGTLRLTLDTAKLLSTVPLQLPTGSAANPVYTFSAEQDIGMYREGTDVLGFTTAGVQRLIIDANGNVGISTSTFGTSAVGVLALVNKTVPSTSPADTVQLFSVDIAADNASLGLRTEAAVAIETNTSNRRLTVNINGTNYKLLLST